MPRAALIDADELLAAARSQFDQAEDERSLTIGQWSDDRLLLPRGSGMVAHQYRLIEARKLIQVCVEYLPGNKERHQSRGG